MGLFINSHLHSLSMHKRLTELEKLSEISTGILALKAMVEDGGDLSGRQMALDNLARMMPMLTKTQQDFVLNEIFVPLLASDEQGDLLNQAVDPDGEVDPLLENTQGAASDYEMEFQLKLNRQSTLDIKQLNREQRNYRHAKEQERLKEERVNQAREQLYERIEAAWAQINHEEPPHRLNITLYKFLYMFGSGLGHEHPLIHEARGRIKQIK